MVGVQPRLSLVLQQLCASGQLPRHWAGLPAREGAQEHVRWAPVALAFFVGFVLIFPVQIERGGDDLLYFGALEATSGLPAWVTLPVVFLAVAGVTAMIAEGVGRTFVEFEPLEAYRLDIAGSILGILSFSILAFVWAPPVVWGAVAAVLFFTLLPRPLRPLQVVALAGLALMLGRESTVPQFHGPPTTRSPWLQSRVGGTSPPSG